MTTETLYALNIVRTYWPDKGNIYLNTDTYDVDSKCHIIAVASIDEVAALAKKYIADILRYEFKHWDDPNIFLSSFEDYTTKDPAISVGRLFELEFKRHNGEGCEDHATYVLRAAKVAYQKP